MRQLSCLPSIHKQLQEKLADGYTVYLSTAIHKVKHGKATIEFEPHMRMDEEDLRPVLAGGFLATKDEDIIARIDSIPSVFSQKFTPDASGASVEAVAVDASAEALLANVGKRVK